MSEIASAFVSIVPSAKGFASKLASDTSGETSKAGGFLGGLLGKTMLAGFAAIGIAGVVGKELYDIGSTFDDISDSIRISTGKSGAALDSLTQSAENVGKRAPVALDTIAPVLGKISDRLDLTGKPLEKLSTQFLDLGHLLGQDVDVDTVTKAFSAFGVKGADTSKALDQIFRVTQSTGIGFDSLTSTLSRNGPVLSQFGFSLNQSASLIGSLDKAGLDSNKTLASLSKAMATFAKAGQDPQKALLGTIDQIQTFVKAGDQAGAVNVAAKVFGTRGATQFVAAVKSGKLNVDALTNATKGNSDTIIKATSDTSDFAEAFQIFKNKALIAVEPIATRVFNALGQGLQALSKGGALKAATVSLSTLGATFLGVFNPIAANLLPRVSVAIQQLLPPTASLVKNVGGSLLRAFGDLVVVLSPLITDLAKLGAAVLPPVAAILSRVGSGLTTVTGFLRDNAGATRAVLTVLAAGVTAYYAYTAALAVVAAATKGYTALTKGAAAVQTAYTAVMSIGTSTFGTRVGVMAIDTAAWISNTAATVADTVATTANSVVTKISSLNIGTRLGLLAGSVASWVANTAAMVANTAATVAANVATKAYAAGQFLLNAALTANPIGLVVVAIAALVAGIIIAYKKSETFRAIVDGAFKGIKKIVSSVINFIVPFVKAHWGLLVSIIGGPLAIVVVQVIKHFDTIKKIAKAAVDFVIGTAKGYAQFASAVVEKVGKVVAFFKALPGKIKGYLNGLIADLKRIGGEIMAGLLKGITNGATAVYNKAKEIAGKVKDTIKGALHINSPSKDMMPVGSSIPEGLAVGMGQGTKFATSAAAKLADTLSKKVGDGLDKAKKNAKKKAAELVKSITDKLSGLKDDLAGLVDPIASNFTNGLFDFDTASAFSANLSTVKTNLQGLLGNFQKLIGEGLSPGFLYQLFQNGGPGLINSLAGLDKASALGIAGQFGEVTSLSDQLGNRVALATDKGEAIQTQTAALSAKLDKLTEAVKQNGKDVADGVNGAASKGRDRNPKKNKRAAARLAA